jgi:hypothetical protein
MLLNKAAVVVEPTDAEPKESDTARFRRLLRAEGWYLSETGSLIGKEFANAMDIHSAALGRLVHYLLAKGELVVIKEGWRVVGVRDPDFAFDRIPVQFTIDRDLEQATTVHELWLINARLRAEARARNRKRPKSVRWSSPFAA